ncbi:Ldh family oxidoreductase [Corynebacterium halotolerans]|uniref:Ldh family oxidoreductase n=1 Tax=Corynebacterium halotolerans TaxID=225326 RepID=UPI003CFA0CCF
MLIAAGELAELCSRAARHAGADTLTARHLADATVQAELRGHSAVGVRHLFDFLAGLRTGRIDGQAAPTVTRAGPILRVDAHDNIAHVGFAEALGSLAVSTRETGVAVLSLANTFTVGELGHYTAALADRGLVALAVANSPALVAYGGHPGSLLGTNPFSLAAPADPAPLLIDQSITPVAYVSIRDAAASGGFLPEGWALDSRGRPTMDPLAALSGSLLPANRKLGNLGLAVEVLTAMTGANWSVDAPSFEDGTDPPRVGLLVLAFDPAAFASGFSDRLQQHLARLEDDYDVSLPGRRRARADSIFLDDELHGVLVAASSETSP